MPYLYNKWFMDTSKIIVPLFTVQIASYMYTKNQLNCKPLDIAGVNAIKLKYLNDLLGKFPYAERY